MTRFRHDLILRMIKLLDAVLVTIPFAMCWYLYYAKRVASPYYAKGDYLVVALFFVLFIIFGRVYDAFLMSMQRISEIIYEQFLAAAVSDFIMYIVIWLLSKQLPNILPGVAALVGQVIMASIWAYNAHHAYFKTFPPQATAVIYDTRRGMEQLIGKHGLDAKFMTKRYDLTSKSFFIIVDNDRVRFLNFNYFLNDFKVVNTAENINDILYT